MRALRTVSGVLLLLAGVPMVLLAAIGWSVLRQGPDGEGFAPTRAFVRTDGRAILLTDVAAMAGRARTAVLPGSDRVRVVVRSGSGPLFVGLAPTVQARRYLEGVAHTEVSAAGGAFDVDGPVPPAAAAAQSFWDATGQRRDAVLLLEVTPRPDASLVIVKANGDPTLDATVSVAAYPAWVGAGTWWLLVGGLGAVMAGVALLAWPQRRREVVLVVEANRMVEFAERLGESLGGPAVPVRGETVHSGSVHSGSVHSGRHLDVTGELVALERVGRQGRHGRDPYVNDTQRLTALEPNQRHAGLHDPTGESPYVTTAT